MTAPQEPATAPGSPPATDHLNDQARGDRRHRLYQTAAWVAIVAGVVFIVGAVFFTGFALGRHNGYGGGYHGRMERTCPHMMPMMGDDRPGGMTGPGRADNGMGGPGMRPPGNPPQPPPTPARP